MVLRERPVAHLALFIVNFLYGVNYVVAKGLMPAIIGPSGFILMRVVGAGLLFWILLATRPQRVATTDLARLLICALFGVALNQLMFFHGLMRTSPMNASIIMVATPILVLVMAGLLLKERTTWTRIGGVLLGAGGALTLIMLNAADDGSGATALGDVLILVNAASYAVFLVLVKPLMRKYSAVTVMAWCFLLALPMVAPFGWQEFHAVIWNQLAAAHWIAMLFVVVMVTFVAYLLNTWALGRVSPTVVGTYIYLQPVLAALATWSFVRIGPERLGIPGSYQASLQLPQLLCAAAIFAGVHLVSKPERIR